MRTRPSVSMFNISINTVTSRVAVVIDLTAKRPSGDTIVQPEEHARP